MRFKETNPAYVSSSKPDKTGSMPVSIQLEPPEMRKWKHRNFPHQKHCACFLIFSVLRQTHRAPIGAVPPAAASSLSRHRPRTPPWRRENFPRTTPDAGRASLAFHFLGEQAYQCNVHLPGPSNLFLTLVEENDKFLSTIFWQRFDETGPKTVCSEPCCLVHRGKHFVHVLELNFWHVLICLRTSPDFLDCQNCVLGRVSCLLPLCYPRLETRCHHVNWCVFTSSTSCGFVPILPVHL